jgi:hypothetical protein
LTARAYSPVSDLRALGNQRANVPTQTKGVNSMGLLWIILIVVLVLLLLGFFSRGYW